MATTLRVVRAEDGMAREFDDVVRCIKSD